MSNDLKTKSALFTRSTLVFEAKIGLLINAIIMVVVYQIGIMLTYISALLVLTMIYYLLVLYLDRKDRISLIYDLQLFYSAFAIISIQFLANWMWFEALFFIPIAINSYLDPSKTGKWKFIWFASFIGLALLFLVLEFFEPNSRVLTTQELHLNQLAIGVFIFYCGSRIFYLVLGFQFSLKETEKAVLEKEIISKRYTKVFDHAPIGILVWSEDPDPTLLDCNSAFAKMLGVKERKELIGKSLSTLSNPNIHTPSDLCSEWSSFLDDSPEKGELKKWSFQNHKQETVTCTLSLSRFEVDNQSQLLIIARNIQKEEDAKQKVNFVEVIYQTVVNESFEGIDIIELKGIDPKTGEYLAEILLRNDTMADMLQNSEDPLISIKAIQKISPEKRPNGEATEQFLRREMIRLLKNRRIIHNWQFVYPNGKKMDVEINSNLIEINGRELLVRFFTDVTIRRNQERIIQNQITDLNTKNQELEAYIASNLELENFAYVASHDLKAPLRTIVSFIQLLEGRLKNKVTEKEAVYLSQISSAAHSMNELIADLLLFSTINNKKIELQEIQMESFQDELYNELTASIKDQNAKLEFNQMPKSLIADRIKLKQLMQNLISNALKFAKPQTKPHIQVSGRETPEDWIIMISDNGIGIPEEYQEKIFLLFKRLHNQTEYEGTGIGLAICKKIVAQHDGKIWVDSQKGKGSTFHFSLPKHNLSSSTLN